MSKDVFVKNFGKFLIENVPYFDDLKSLVYDSDGDSEWLYVNYQTHSQKRINIKGNSEYAIMLDFFNNVEKSDWVLPMNKDVYEK